MGVTFAISSDAVRITGGLVVDGTTFAAQSVQTQAAGAIARSGFTTTTIGGDVVAGTLNTDGLKLAVPAYLTAAAGGGLTNIRVSGGTTSNLLSAITFADSNGISFGLNASTMTASHNGLTAQSVQTQASGNIPRSGFTTTTVGGDVVAGTNNTDGLKLAVPAYLTTAQAPGAYLTTARASNDAVGLNTAKTNVTWTINSSGLSFDASGYAGTGTSATNASITLNSAGLAISVAAPGGGAGINRSALEIMEGERTMLNFNIASGSFSKRPIFVPFYMPGGGLSVKTVDFYASRAAGTSLNMTYGIGFYSMVNSTRMDLVSSTTNAISLTTSAQWSGLRRYQITGLSAFELTEGRWMAALYFSGSNNSTAVAQMSVVGADPVFAPVGYCFPGTNSTGATSGSEHIFPFWGVYSATSAGFPASVHRSEISGQGNTGVNVDPYVVIREI